MPFEWSPAIRKAVIDALRTEFTIGAAAKLAGVPKRTVDHWYEKDITFRAECDEARSEAVDVLETSLYKKAMERGGTEAFFFLNGRRSEVYNRGTKTEHTGTIRIEIVNSPDQLSSPNDLTIEAGDESTHHPGQIPETT